MEFMYWHQRSEQGEGRMMQERRSPFTLSGRLFVFDCCLLTSNTALLLGFVRKNKIEAVSRYHGYQNEVLWFEFLVIFTVSS